MVCDSLVCLLKYKRVILRNFGHTCLFCDLLPSPVLTCFYTCFYLFIELEIFIGKSPDYYSFSKSTGIVVFINNNSTLYSDAEAIMVSAGTETNIALTKRFTTSLISPYSPCQIDADTTPTGQALRFKNAKLNYRQTDCISLCYQEALYKHCGCIDLFVSLPDMFFDQGVLPQFCRSNNYTTCCLDEFLNTNFADDCQIKCPLECETEEFQYSISFADVRLLISFLFN